MENHFIRISFPSEDDLTLDFRFEIHSWQEREREKCFLRNVWKTAKNVFYFEQEQTRANKNNDSSFHNTARS